MDVTIEEYAGPHRDLAWSFREAEDSERLLDAYIDLGRLWVAVTTEGETVAHLQAVPRGDGVWEVTNTAVAEAHRGQGIGRLLLRARRRRGQVRPARRGWSSRPRPQTSATSASTSAAASG